MNFDRVGLRTGQQFTPSVWRLTYTKSLGAAALADAKIVGLIPWIETVEKTAETWSELVVVVEHGEHITGIKLRPRVCASGLQLGRSTFCAQSDALSPEESDWSSSPQIARGFRARADNMKQSAAACYQELVNVDATRADNVALKEIRDGDIFHGLPELKHDLFKDYTIVFPKEATIKLGKVLRETLTAVQKCAEPQSGQYDKIPSTLLSVLVGDTIEYFDSHRRNGHPDPDCRIRIDVSSSIVKAAGLLCPLLVSLERLNVQVREFMVNFSVAATCVYISDTTSAEGGNSAEALTMSLSTSTSNLQLNELAKAYKMAHVAVQKLLLYQNAISDILANRDVLSPGRKVGCEYIHFDPHTWLHAFVTGKIDSIAKAGNLARLAELMPEVMRDAASTLREYYQKLSSSPVLEADA